MINLIEELKDWNLKRQLRTQLAPSKSFLKSARVLFLNRVSTDLARGRTPLHHHVIKWRYALIAVVVIFSVTGGLMTYADAADVPATHPLYQFKRMSEQLRLQFSTPAEQVQLKQDFAERRIREINEIKAQNPNEDTPTIQNLSNDFQHDADDTIDQSAKINMVQKQRKVLCQNLLTAVDHTVPDPQLTYLKTHCEFIMSQ